MSNIILLESDGIYTAYQKHLEIDSTGNSIETVTRIQIPMPNPDIPFSEWAKTLSDDEVEVGLQLFFDKWNFTSGNEIDRETYEALHQERTRRNTPIPEVTMMSPGKHRNMKYVRTS